MRLILTGEGTKTGQQVGVGTEMVGPVWKEPRTKPETDKGNRRDSSSGDFTTEQIHLSERRRPRRGD